MKSILDRFRLDGQVAIVTGSGRGIGAATALAPHSTPVAARQTTARWMLANAPLAFTMPPNLVPSYINPVSPAARPVDRQQRRDELVAEQSNVGGSLPNHGDPCARDR